MYTQIIRKLSDAQLHEATVRGAKTEQKATIDLLLHLAENKRRRLYAEMGFASLWEYVRNLGYSEPATSERLRAMELMTTTPGVEDCLTRGELTLTTAAQIQRYVRKLETITKKPMSETDKETLIEAAAGKSKREVETLLLERTPKELLPQLCGTEQSRMLTENLREVRLVIDPELELLLARYKELKGHMSMVDILKTALTEYLDRKDPLRTPMESAHINFSEVTSASLGRRSRYIPANLRRFVMQRAGGRCEFLTSHGKRCKSKYRLEVDHIQPFALGGPNTAENLRALCPTHNQLHARRCFAEFFQMLLKKHMI